VNRISDSIRTPNGANDVFLLLNRLQVHGLKPFALLSTLKTPKVQPLFGLADIPRELRHIEALEGNYH